MGAVEVSEMLDVDDVEVPDKVHYQSHNDKLFRELFEYQQYLDSDDPDVVRRYESLADQKVYEIVEFNLGLANSYVRKFTRKASAETKEELTQAAMLGLLKAIRTYDPDRGVFSSWAFKPIQREVLIEVHRADFQTLRPADFERRAQIIKVIQKMYPDGEGIDIDVVAAKVDMTPEQVSRVVHAVSLSSIHAPIGEDSTLEEVIADDAVSIEDQVATNQLIRSVQINGLEKLSARERYVIVRRFGLDSQPDQKLTEIGDEMGLSREAIRQIEAKAIAKLGHPALLSTIVRAEGL